MKLQPPLDPCTHCGACLSFCAWDAAEREGESGSARLCRDCMVCYQICPRLPTEDQSLADRFPLARDAPWGPCIDFYTVIPSDPIRGAQDGGIVSLLGQHILDAGLVEAVLVTGREPDWRPRSYWATEEDQVVAACGSKYSAAPALASLQEGLERFNRIAIVALPCQCAALARLDRAFASASGKIALVVGLFCSESFCHDHGPDSLVRVVESKLDLPVAEVNRFEVEKGRLTARAGRQVASWDLKELTGAVWPICHACQDLTAELADLAIGSIGSSPGRNTVIVRSQRAMAVMRSGLEAGLWRMEPVERPEVLGKLCDRKRDRAAELSEKQVRLYGRESVRGVWKRHKG